MLITVASLGLHGQSDNRVLIRIDSTEITVSEFIRLYDRNMINGERQNINEYFDHFILYRLKVAHAMNEGLHTSEEFKNELKGYRHQVAAKYLIDTLLFEEMITRAYERIKYEINASHILISVPPEFTTDDTLNAYKRAEEILVRLKHGESFREVAISASDDHSAIYNGGNLGYFTSQQMVMPFEDAVYALNPGEISQPVRTAYGYHLIKMHDKRESRGIIKVAHIMKALPQGADEKEKREAEREIRAIYNRVMAGESFMEIAKNESDHRESASGGGELAWFKVGEIAHEFAEAAFSLPNNDDISEPVQTPYGWHIIKRVDWRDIGSLEDNRSELEIQLSNSHLHSVARKSLVEKLKKEYGYTINNTVVQWFYREYAKLIENNRSQFNPSTLPEGDVFKFRGGKLEASVLAQILESNISAAKSDNHNAIIDNILDNISNERLLAHENSRLEEKYPEFKYLMKEYHDGILLFEITSKEIWNKSLSDTTGLYDFYESNISRYTEKDAARGKVYHIEENENLRLLKRLVNRHADKRYGDERIVSAMKRRRDAPVLISDVQFYEGEDKTADLFIEGRLKTMKSTEYNKNSLLLIEEILRGKPKEPETIMSELVTHYQEYLETLWNKQLKEKYSVWIDEDIRKELTTKYNEK
jgi:peptidyl-prolyl cis-trans isomerase SurA